MPQVQPQAQAGMNRRGCLTTIIAVVVLGVIIVVVASVLLGHSGPTAKITPKVDNVVVLDGSTVRIYITWQNAGAGAMYNLAHRPGTPWRS